MSPSVREYLRHILDESSYLMGCVQRLDRDRFLRDETLKRAFVRSVEIIWDIVANKVPVLARDIREVLDRGEP